MNMLLSSAPFQAIADPMTGTHAGLRSGLHRYASWLRLSDAAVVTVSVYASQLLRFGYDEASPTMGSSLLSAVIACAWIASLAIFRTRSERVLGSGTEEYRLVWTATMFTFLSVAVASSVMKLDISRGYLAIALPLGLLGLTANRHFVRRRIVAQRREGRFCNRVLAVGQPDAVDRFATSLARDETHGYVVVGSCASTVARGLSNVESTDGRPFDEFESEFAAAVRTSAADTVALVSGDLTPDEMRDLLWELKRLDVELVVSPGVVDVARPRLAIRAHGGLPLIHIDKPQYDGTKRFAKRAFDMCFALLALAGATPILLAAAAAIKLSSPGPVFYRSVRIGLDGTPFEMIKLRTMVVDADRMVAAMSHMNEGNGVLFKLRRDPRVTPVGRVLRRFSIDELPQFLNVARGEMSVVGPRPPLPSEVDAYDEHIRRRLLVRPGITGLWQVSGRSDLSWDESVRLDLSYVENWSMIADLVIAASTLRAVFKGTGAY